MSAVGFCTTSNGYLPHYSYIFRKPDTLGTYINNVACSMLRTMIHLDVQKGKEAMKSSNFQQHIVETATCMKRLMMD